jgi:hypothetical protein
MKALAREAIAKEKFLAVMAKHQDRNNDDELTTQTIQLLTPDAHFKRPDLLMISIDG